MRHGVPIEKLQALGRFREDPRFDERERLALEFAERMTITGERVTDDLVARLRRHFSEAEVVELAATVALENFRSRFNVALAIESQGFCALPLTPPGHGPTPAERP